MTISRASRDAVTGLLVTSALVAATPVAASVELSADWTPQYLPNGGGRVPNDPNYLTVRRLEKVAESASVSRSAAVRRDDTSQRDFDVEPSYKLDIDNARHYLAPARFMTKSQPGEVCTPSNYVNRPTYQCNEGQRYTNDCHLLVFNDKFEEVGYHRIAVREPFKFFCNAVLGVGVGDKANNQLLVSVQYFPIDAQPARQISELGSSWRRMTVAVALTLGADGKVQIEQQEDCLPNPNQIEDVPTARQALKRCRASPPARKGQHRAVPTVAGETSF